MGEKSIIDSISVISYNILGSPFVTTHQVKNFLSLSKHFLFRMRTIAKQLNESDADVIMLQEVHLSFVLTLFKKHLTNYPYVAYKKLHSRARGGLVVFSKFPIEYTSFTDFHFRGPVNSKAVVTRIVRNGILFVKLQDKSIVLVNVYVNGDHTHLWNENSKYHKIQESQIDQLTTLLNFIKQLGNTTILSGDINFPRSSPNYLLMRKLVSLHDLFSISNKPTYRSDFLPEGVAAQALDYILVISDKKGIRASNKKYVFENLVRVSKKKKIYLSDHIGLSATIHIPL